MKFFRQFLNTKAPSPSTLLDVALVLSVIPHLFVMTFYMLLYICIALIFIFKKKKYKADKYILMFIGAVLISITFFDSYNLSNFSRIQFFVSLVSALLIYAVTLQKTTQELNKYLKISPALLMLLSFFFFDTITMLIYSIFTLFVFVTLYIWDKMGSRLIEAVKFTSRLFIISLPLVVLLFLVFPRISIQKADFGFRSDSYTSSGYDGKMSVSSKEIRLSNKVVMELFFNDANISDEKLYLRGSTLYKQDKLEWKKLSTELAHDTLVKKENIVEYEITIYPHANKWIYSLDMPTQAIKNSKLNYDYTLSSDKPIYEKKKFKLHSALSYRLYSKNFSEALEVDLKKNEKTSQALKYIKKQNIPKPKKAELLLNFFKDQKLSYTLKPTGIDLEDFTDSFLFQSKNGYCIHFASAFANSARILDIPSRVVTGFKANKENMIKNYLLVKEADAHAWVELYFDAYGWVRFDPTATAFKKSNALQNIQNQQNSKIFQKINHYFMYTKYIINNWVLDYNRVKQLAILDKLLSDTLYLLKFVLSFVFLVFLVFIGFISIKNSRSEDELMLEMQKLLKILKKHRLVKEDNENMQMFLQRSQKEVNISLEKINNIYHSLKYKRSDNAVTLTGLKKEIKGVLKLLPKISAKE